jgi:hypothetical protein
MRSGVRASTIQIRNSARANTIQPLAVQRLAFLSVDFALILVARWHMACHCSIGGIMTDQNKVLGDINPVPDADQKPGSMNGGSQEDRTKHAGSRDLTESTTTGTEVGGTRNYRTGTGATGGDIGNRPE